ncbi:MAG: hypothetical protein ACRDD7_03880 [Peptostreptococcaceae bacterium]
MEGSNVAGAMTKPLVFGRKIVQSELENFKWKFKNKNPNNWRYFFNQGGVTEISKEDFIGILQILNK